MKNLYFFCCVLAVLLYSNKLTGSVALRLFDMTGKLLATLLQKEMPEGHASVDFDGRDLPAGLYFVQIETKGGTIFQSLIKQKQE